MSQPPNYPGRRRMKRAAGSAGSDAYQGALEAVGSVLIACAFGYWVDHRWDTAPIGLLVGVVVGFAAMVLRLVRMGKELRSEADGAQTLGPGIEEDVATGESPGISSVLRDDVDAADGKPNKANGERE